MSNVKLAIRVRPFTEKEQKSDKDRFPVIDVCDENTVSITNIKVSLSGAGDSRERVRRYFADYTFDSACASSHPAYATQEKVFKSIGRDVLSVLSMGRSACVLAYGQSATGKTHTMMGTDEDPGLIPRICQDLAKGIAFDVTVSYLEIYNERVHDLLACEEPLHCQSLPRRRGNTRKDLRVREHPDRGPFVQNLRRVAVQDVPSLLAVVREGTRRRRTAATRRNLTSSRSHALLEIVTPRATLHLADLAGSEKASWEGCARGRQKEGANINKSLVALSNVISALAVSPSVSCYGESASTLRWSERARQLPPPTTARATQCANRNALQAQLDLLLAELARHYITYVPEIGKIYFEESHWNQAKETLDLNDCFKNSAKIGNIMNLARQKNDAHNSESTASSVASEGSDVFTVDKNVNIENEINEEVDKILGPVLERARSGTDLEVVAPLRHKKRQYRSQEVLSLNKALQEDQSLAPLNNQLTTNGQKVDSSKSPPIFYDNQRAEIVASVTDRLYTKFKKKEEAAVSKMEAVVDKKIIEPLSELRICTNARQRLIDLGRKTPRNKRRIGIPAYTQTKHMVIRVREQGTDIQSDLEPYIIKEGGSYIFHKDIGTETTTMTPRCKDKSVGPKYGSVYFSDGSTITEGKQIKKFNNTLVMTDEVVKSNSGTQTTIVPPPRRKKRVSALTKYIKSQNMARIYGEAFAVSPAISINISQNYPEESESQSSEENVRNVVQKNTTPTMTPDLLTNHSNAEKIVSHEDNIIPTEGSEYELTYNDIENKCVADEETQIDQADDFSDSDDQYLPRVKITSSGKSNQDEFKNIILGQNPHTFPYNIQISPYKEKEETQRTVKFKDNEKQLQCNARQNMGTVKTESYVNKAYFNDSYLCSPYNTDCSKSDADSFVYKNMKNTSNEKKEPKKNNNNIPVRKEIQKIPKSQYQQFLGLQNKRDENLCSQRLKEDYENGARITSKSQERFISSRKFFEEKEKYGDSFEDLENKVLESCDRLGETAKRYGEYFSRSRYTGRSASLMEVPATKPTIYLQHLVNLRKEAIKAQIFSETLCRSD